MIKMEKMLFLICICTMVITTYSKSVDGDNIYFENCLQNILSIEFIDDVILFYKSRGMNFKNFSSKTSIILSNGVQNVTKHHKESVIKLRQISYNQRISLIYFVYNTADIQILQRILMTTSFYKGKFLIFFQQHFYNILTVQKLLYTAYNHGVSNIALGVFNNGSVIFHSWFPFDKENKCGRKINLKTFHICSGFYELPTLYKNKLYNLRECSLKLTYIKSEPFVIDVNVRETPGLFVSLFNTIQNVTGIKMKYEYKRRFQKEFLNRGSLTRLFSHLVKEKTDVVLGHLFMNLTSDNTIPGPQIYSDNLIWVAPKPKLYTTYRNILKPFRIDLWSLHISLFVFITLFLKLLYKHYEIKHDSCNLLLNVFKITIDAAVSSIPEINAIRILIFFYTTYCIDMDTLYIGKLSSIFTIPKTSMKISNIEQFFLNGMFVNISRYVNALTNLLNFITNENVAKEILILNVTDAELFKKVAATQSNGTVIFKSTAATYSSEANAVDMFTVQSRSLFLCYYLRNFNMVNEPIIYWTHEVIEKGLFRKWWLDIIHSYKNYTLLKRTEQQSNIETIAYSVDHYEQAIFILISGHSVAVIIFIFEFFSKWIEKKIAYMKDTSFF